MSQLFSNNAESALSASLSDVATSATVTNGAAFKAPTGDDYELLTLLAAGVFEIVRVTARSSNTLTITRAQEGTTARTWAAGTSIFGGVTAGTLADALTPGLENQAAGSGSIALGTTSAATGSFAAAYGVEATANANYSVGVGWRSKDHLAYGTGVGAASLAHADATAVGAYAFADTNGVTVGRSADSTGAGCTVIGRSALAEGADSIVVGRNSWAYANSATVIGPAAQLDYDADFGIAIGRTFTERPKTVQVGALPVVPRTTYSGLDVDAVWQSVGSQCVIMTRAKSLKTLESYTLDLPTGITFYPDEVGIIITSATGVTGQPTVRFGITGTEAAHLAATETTGLTAAMARQRFETLVTYNGAQTLRAEVTVAATGTTLVGRFYWRGWAVAGA